MSIAPPSEPHYSDSTITLHHGDCLDVLATLPDASVDSVVTDPPYGLANTDPAHVVETITRWVNGERDYLPGGAGFMGKAWDAFVPPVAVWDECLRVLKPGGHVLAFAGSRTVDLMTLGLRLAGFDIRDSVAWLYGSGFPKSLDVSKAIDKAAGAEREVVGTRPQFPDGTRGARARPNACPEVFGDRMGLAGEIPVTAPATDDARTWQGWGTALKPAFEPIVVARKPLSGTVAANVLAHGTGALNIDGCRVGDEQVPTRINTAIQGGNYGRGDGMGLKQETTLHAGRWPANVVLDESQAAALDAQSGELQAGNQPRVRNRDGNARTAYGDFDGQHDLEHRRMDSGGASRFFFIAREDSEPCPSTSVANTAATPSSRPSGRGGSAPSGAATSASPDGERRTGSPSTSATPNASRPSDAIGTPTTPTTAGESSPESRRARPTPTPSPANCAEVSEPTDTTTTTTSPSRFAGCADPATSSTTPNSVPGVPLDELGSRFTYVAKADSSERVRVDGIAHPTVKPLDLMRWLVRLVTPPGGTVLEPFAGSGTTVEACLLEGFRCVAIEREADYLPLIRQRINRRRDPVEAVKGAGVDGGLFDLLDGGAA